MSKFVKGIKNGQHKKEYNKINIWIKIISY